MSRRYHTGRSIRLVKRTMARLTVWDGSTQHHTFQATTTNGVTRRQVISNPALAPLIYKGRKPHHRKRKGYQLP